MEFTNVVRGIIDENVFDLLDKTEHKLYSLQRENISLMEELATVYQEWSTWNQQMSINFDLMEQFMAIMQDLTNGNVTRGPHVDIP